MDSQQNEIERPSMDMPGGANEDTQMAELAARIEKLTELVARAKDPTSVELGKHLSQLSQTLSQGLKASPVMPSSDEVLKEQTQVLAELSKPVVTGATGDISLNTDDVVSAEPFAALNAEEEAPAGSESTKVVETQESPAETIEAAAEAMQVAPVDITEPGAASVVLGDSTMAEVQASLKRTADLKLSSDLEETSGTSDVLKGEESQAASALSLEEVDPRTPVIAARPSAMPAIPPPSIDIETKGPDTRMATDDEIHTIIAKERERSRSRAETSYQIVHPTRPNSDLESPWIHSTSNPEQPVKLRLDAGAAELLASLGAPANTSDLSGDIQQTANLLTRDVLEVAEASTDISMPVIEEPEEAPKAELEGVRAEAEALKQNLSQEVSQVAQKLGKESDEPAEGLQTLLERPQIPRSPHVDAVRVVPKEMAYAAMVVPLRFSQGELTCLVREPHEPERIQKLATELWSGRTLPSRH